MTTPNPRHPLPVDPRVHKVELLISTLLRAGVIASLFFVVFGTALSFVHHPDYRTSRIQTRDLTREGAQFPHTLRDVASGVRHLRGQAIVVLGLILLIATPVLRVAISIFAFLYQRDWIFVAITTLVLVLLLLSFLLGKVE
jgi:uncharacterized membrane protein